MQIQPVASAPADPATRDRRIGPGPAGRLLACVLLALPGGCANHLRSLEVEAEKRFDAGSEVHLGLDGPEEVLQSSTVELTLYRDTIVKTRVETRRVQIVEATPYRGEIELYEVPVGLVSVPLSLAFHLVNLGLFGYVPDRLIEGYTEWSFAALNPFMNTESSARAERIELSSRPLSSRDERETRRTPLVAASLQLALDGRPPVQLHTGERGEVSVQLLDLLGGALEVTPRRLWIAPQSDREGMRLAGLDRMLFLDRQLATRLRHVSVWLEVLATDRPTPAELATAVFELDRLGFHVDSLRAEDRIYQRFAGAGDLLDAFRADLHALYRDAARWRDGSRAGRAEQRLLLPAAAAEPADRE